MTGVFLIVRKSLRQHALSSAVTVASVALAAGLVMAVFAVARQSRLAFAGGSLGYDAVLGARGSELQLVLNTVFHLETSPGNLPWSTYEAIAADPRVELALPYAVGDHYKGFRVVGTDARVFDELEYGDGRKLAFAPGGRAFDPARREAVVGARVARETGLALGSHFQPAHGVQEGPASHDHDEQYVVVGVLEPTGTPSDRVVWIPIEGIYRMSGHELRGTGDAYVAEPGVPIDDAHKEVSAVMLKLRGKQAGFQLAGEYNRRGAPTTLAWPINKSVAQLFDKLGWVQRVLELVAYLVVLVAGGTILASLYNTMNERRREFAILRSLGARRRTVFGVIVLEAATLAFLGCLLGYAVYAAILVGAASVVRAETGVVLELWSVHPALWLTPLGLVVVGALAGVLPAQKAYATDVALTLARG
ncbi:MAG: ABC transporter permease [Planctomycetes bacterium]|nr:ABC transporter permease [Planctomycetota bacterium]